MGDIHYVDEVQPRNSRVGGFFATIEELEHAASLLDFDVVAGPKNAVWGFYMTPAGSANSTDSQPKET